MDRARALNTLKTLYPTPFRIGWRPSCWQYAPSNVQMFYFANKYLVELFLPRVFKDIKDSVILFFSAIFSPRNPSQTTPVPGFKIYPGGFPGTQHPGPSWNALFPPIPRDRHFPGKILEPGTELRRTEVTNFPRGSWTSPSDSIRQRGRCSSSGPRLPPQHLSILSCIPHVFFNLASISSGLDF